MSNKLRPKLSVFIATSMDGYIAKKDGDITWLTTFSAPTAADEDKDCGFSQFFSSVDVLVMGKNSYEAVVKFDPWPYQGKRVVVLSSSLTSVCKQAELFSGNATNLVEKLHAEGAKHIYVDGGVTISNFLNADLIDEMIISLIPVVLGSGIPLFSNIKSEKWCRSISSHAYSNGLIQIKYEIVKNMC